MVPIRFDETDDLIDICLDNVFKAVFTKNTPESQGALSNLLSALIGRELTVVTITTNEPPIDNIRDRQIRFDINCKAETGERVNVEMSLNPDAFEPIRLEFHAGKLFTGQDIRGRERNYGDLKESWQIAFLVKGRFFQDDDFFHIFEYYDPIRRVSLKGRSRIITLELSKVERVGEKPVTEMTAQEHWAYFFRYLMDRGKREKINEVVAREEGIAMASQVLISISRDEVERARLMSEYKYELDLQSKVVYAKREGRKEGLEKGLQKGREEGRQKGLQEGRQEEKLEIARKMKSRGIAAEQIAGDTGLSLKQVEDL
jgi:predicted transposase/invertase (TIGR01784 family)